MQLRKKGSLELSVNAIVVFIIAFAMLGVGLFFINKLRGTIDIDTTKFLPANTMSNPPTSDNPLTIDDVKMKTKDQKPINIGIYAKDRELTGVRFRIVSCTDAATNVKITKTVSTSEPKTLSPDLSCKPDGDPLCPELATVSLPEISGEYDGTIAIGEAGTVPSYLNGKVKGFDSILAPGVYTCTIAALINDDNEIIRTTQFRLEIIS
jgi:hypothetical protein